MALFLSVVAASASPVILSGSGFGAGTAFWQNTSYDRNGQAHIGNWITNSGASDVPNFYANAPGIGATWLGDGYTTFLFDFTNPTLDPNTITHWFSVTGWNDEFGIYNATDGTHIKLGNAWDQQYASVGRNAPLFTPGLYGFYMVSGEGYTWYSGQLGFDNRSHFALFQGSTPYSWYLGMEDATFTTHRTADWDYNDVILEITTPQPVPEPGGISLLGIGLLAIARAYRKWRV